VAAREARASLEAIADEWEALDRLKTELVLKLQRLPDEEPRNPVHMQAVTQAALSRM